MTYKRSITVFEVFCQHFFVKKQKRGWIGQPVLKFQAQKNGDSFESPFFINFIRLNVSATNQQAQSPDKEQET